MLVSSWQQLVKAFPQLKEREDGATLALRKYLELGGIVKIEKKGKSFTITYPTKQVITQRIKKLEEEKRRYERYLHRLQKTKKEVSQVKLAFDPLFYQHMLKMLADKEYREAFQKLGLDWRAFLHPKTREIIRAFMKNEEYRQRVLEALDESPFYKKRKFGELIEDARQVRDNIAQRKEEVLRKKIKELETEIFVLRQLLRWM